MTVRPRSLALLFAVEALLFVCLVFALLDRRARQRDVIFGVNQWGYRDEARGSKEPGERRIAIVGGSSAFEARRAYDVTLAGQLFIELRQAGSKVQQEYSVVNLSQPRAGADTYVRTLHEYGYLNPDVVCVADGYDTASGEPPFGRNRSAVFRATGYLPILPARLLGRPAWLSDQDLGIAPLLRDAAGQTEDVSCAGASAAYCGAITNAVHAARNEGRAVVVVSLPSVSIRHARQQQSLGETLLRTFGGDARFLYLDLGGLLDRSDPIHLPDGIHRSDVGNHVVGQRLARAILEWPGAFARR